MSRPRLAAGSRSTRSPAMWIVPELTSSSPAIRRKSVVLPQPEGPTNTVNSCFSISRPTPWMISVSPNALTNDSIFTCGVSEGLSKNLSLDRRSVCSSDKLRSEGCDQSELNAALVVPDAASLNQVIDVSGFDLTAQGCSAANRAMLLGC